NPSEVDPTFEPTKLLLATTGPHPPGRAHRVRCPGVFPVGEAVWIAQAKVGPAQEPEPAVRPVVAPGGDEGSAGDRFGARLATRVKSVRQRTVEDRTGRVSREPGFAAVSGAAPAADPDWGAE